MSSLQQEKNSVASKVMTHIFLPYAFGHYTSFIFRNINAVLAPTLITTLGLTGAQLGLISSAYFLSFGLAQLPVGLALDKYGPKFVQLVLLGIAIIGSLLFAVGETFEVFFLARILIGLGLAACFMGSLKALSFWVPHSRLPSMHGYLLAVGGLGAMTATLPIAWAIGYVPWRMIFILMAGVILIAMAAIAFLVPNDQSEHKLVKWPTIASLAEVYRDKIFRRIIGLLLLPHTVAFGLQGLWMGRWLQDVGGLDLKATSVYLFFGMASVVVGSLAVGRITQTASHYGIKPMEVAGIGVSIFVLIQILCAFNLIPLLPALSVGFTLFGTIAGLEYTLVAQSVSPSMTGRAATCLNLLIFFGAFLIQSLFGVILDLWGVDPDGRHPHQAYQAAFLVMILLQLPGLILWLLRIWHNKSFRLNGVLDER